MSEEEIIEAEKVNVPKEPLKEVPKNIEVIFNLHEIGCQHQGQQTVKYFFTDGVRKIEFSTQEFLSVMEYLKDNAISWKLPAGVD